MLIRSVSLRNIRSYEELTLAFEEGSTLLAGDIGAGKSTILQSIEFALFGTQRTALDGESLLRHGADEGSVELACVIQGKDVTITRTLKRSAHGVRQTDCSLALSGSVEELSSQELKARVLELLGYPEQLLSKSKGLIFRHTVYTPQEEMKHIIFMPVEERLNTLRTLFGVEKYRTIKENAQLLLRELRTKERVLLQQALLLPQLEREHGERETAAKDAAGALAQAQKELDDVSKAVEAVKASGRKVQELWEAALTREQDRAVLSGRSRELDRMVRHAREDIERIDASLAIPLAVVEDATEAIDALRTRLDTDERSFLIVTHELAELSGKRALHNDQARSITTLATCPVCKQPVTPEHKHAVQSDADAVIASIDTRLAALRTQEAKLRDARTHTQTEMMRLNEQQRRFSAHQRDVLARHEEKARRARLEERVEELRKEHAMVIQRLEALPPPDSALEAEHRSARAALDDVEAARERVRQAVNDSRDRESAARTALTIAHERLVQAREAHLEVSRLQTTRQWVEEQFLEAVSLIERHVLASLHAEFRERFSHWFSRLIEDETIAVSLGESFEPLVTQNGYDASLEQLSGGEKTAVALSYRLSLYRVVSDFVSTVHTKDFLILDEPTDGFSVEQLDRVRDVLRELGCRQIILVSHEVQMEQTCDHVIRVTKRDHRSAVVA